MSNQNNGKSFQKWHGIIHFVFRRRAILGYRLVHERLERARAFDRHRLRR